MANLTFNFNTLKHNFMNVVLKDDRRLQVKMPRKKTFEKLAEIERLEENDLEVDSFFDTLSALCAEVLSYNMNDEIVTPEYMADNYNFEEMTEFLKKFFVFVGEVAKDPN